jgi:uncharacterized repeat protein (TIGR01451 family)
LKITQLLLGRIVGILVIGLLSTSAHADVTTAANATAANATVSSIHVAPGDEATSSTTKSVGRGSASADLSVILTDFPDPVARGALLDYSIGVQNSGPDPASNASLTTSIPAGTTFHQLITQPGSGWSCSTPAVGATGSVSCTIGSLAPSQTAFTLFVRVDTDLEGTSLTQSIAVDSSTPDPDDGDRSASTTTQVVGPGTTLSASKTASGQFRPGGVVTYQIVVTNQGPGVQPDLVGNEFLDILPAGLTLQSASASSGTAIANLGPNSVTWNGSLVAAGSVAITIRASIAGNLTAGTRIENQAQVFFDTNGDGFVETIATSDDPTTAAAGDATAIVLQGAAMQEPAVVPASSTWTQLLLAAMLTLVAGGMIRRRG